MTSKKTLQNKELLKNIEHKNIIKRINSVIRNREEYRSSTEFQHIYSHINKKLTKEQRR
jgi:hypothetical protein